MKIGSLNRYPRTGGLVSCIAATALISFVAHAADKELKDYRTVKNAVKATVQKQKTTETGQAG